MSTIASQITGVSIVFFFQLLVQAQTEESIKALRHWPLWGEFAGGRWIPSTIGQLRGNVSIWWRHQDSKLQPAELHSFIETEVLLLDNTWPDAKISLIH